MPINKSSASAAKDANVVGEGEGPATFAVADPKGEWFVAKGQFPLIDTESNTRYEGGVPTRGVKTAWVQRQIDALAMEPCDAPEDAKGKAASTPTPSVDETPKKDGSDAAGNGMQSTVMGS